MWPKYIIAHLCIYSVLLCKVSDALNAENLADALINFIQFRNKPTKINFFLECWQKDEIHDFLKSITTNQLFAGFALVNHTDKNYGTRNQWKQSQLYAMDFDCYSKNVFNNTELLQFPQRWFIFVNESSSFPPNLPIYTNSRIFLLEKNEPHNLISLYRNLNQSDYIQNNLGVWSNYTYSSMWDISDYEHRSNQHGLNINSTGVAVYPRTLNYLLDYRFLLEDPLTKHNYILLNHLMDIMNTTLHITFAPGWGTKPANGGPYNMLIGDLQKGISQIGGTISFITADRVEFLDYVANPVPTLGFFIFRPPPLSVVNNILTMPFGPDVWIATGCLCLMVFSLLIVTVKWEWHTMGFEDESPANILRPTPIDIVQLQVGAICQQGTEQEPKSLSGRIIMIFTFVSCLFLYTAYSANIVALLQSSSKSISTLEDLLYSKIKLGADNMPYSKYFFSLQTAPINVAIYKEKMAKPDNFLPPKLGVEKMRTEFYAFHSERDQIYKHMSKTYHEHEKCGLVEIKYLSQNEPYIVIRKYLPYKEIVTMAYSRFKEHGLSNRMYKLLYTEKPKCRNSGGSLQSVGFNEIYFAILLYICGVTGAMLLLTFEKIYSIAKYNKI